MLRRFISLFMVTVIVANTLCEVASAAPYDEPFYSSNDITFYDPRCDTGTARGSLTLAGADKLEKVMNFLMREPLSLTVAQASGVVGNLMAESRLEPAIIQGGGMAQPGYIPVNGVGFGLAQWTFTDRQKPLLDHTTKTLGVPITDLGGQLSFIELELTGKYSSALAQLKATTDPVDAAVVFHKTYEKSADSVEQIRRNRGGNAQGVYDKYKDAAPLAGSTAPDSMNNPGGSASTMSSTNGYTPDKLTKNNSCTPGPGGEGLIETVKRYAWPEYKGLTIIPTEAYKTAVQTAISEKRYVGGTLYKGIDCGGFVTTLIYDSGFDKEYNSGAKGGNTTHQEAWLRANWKPINGRDASDRQPGDVAINNTHTYIFVGPDAFPNRQPIASASWDERAPMQGKESVINMPKHTEFRWYRKKIVTDR